jgi:hypothetical protein
MHRQVRVHDRVARQRREHPARGQVGTDGWDAFSLDLIWLGRNGEVLRVDRDVPPMRVRACRRARSVAETVAGEADAFVSGLSAAERPATRD